MKPIVRVLAIALLLGCIGTAPGHARSLAASSAVCGQAGALPAMCANIVFDGDSIAAGEGASHGTNGLDIHFMQAVGFPARVTNVAVPGRALYGCTLYFRTNVAPLFIPGARLNLIVFHAGDNDFMVRRNAAQTYAAFTQYVEMAHARGFKIIMSTELPRPDFNTERQAGLSDFNRRVLANRAGADAVVDFNTDPRLADLAARINSPLFNPDHMHPRDAGYAVLGQMLAAAARPMFPR